MARRIASTYNSADWVRDMRLQEEMAQLGRVMKEGPPVHLYGGRYFISAGEAAATLGLGPGAQQTAREMIYDLATEARSAADVVREITERGWTTQVTRGILDSAMTLRSRNSWSVIGKSVPLPEGTVRTHGGEQVIKRGGKWVPIGAGRGGDPAENSGQVDPEVAATYRDLSARAKRAGYRVTGSLNPGVTSEHLTNLERAIAAQAESDGNSFERKITKAIGTAQDKMKKAQPDLPARLHFDELGLTALGLVKSKRKTGASTPAEPHERVRGSEKNKQGSAASRSSGSNIELDDVTVTALKRKLEEHNKKSAKKLTLGSLKAVWRRGAGAFSVSHRPGQSRSSWAMARVNSFLRRVKGGDGHTQDDDLIPEKKG